MAPFSVLSAAACAVTVIESDTEPISSWTSARSVCPVSSTMPVLRYLRNPLDSAVNS
jgi:hypothetical protein